MQRLFDALERNGSVQTLRISTAVGCGDGGRRMARRSAQLERLLAAKAKLQTLELAVSSLVDADDESVDVVGADAFQPLVDALVRGLAASSVVKLALDVDLNSAQVPTLSHHLDHSSRWLEPSSLFFVPSNLPKDLDFR